MLTLRDVPETTSADFWDHVNGSDDRSMNFVVWPADAGRQLVRVRISTLALGEYDGKSLGIHTGNVRAALERHRDLIQRLAQAKYGQQPVAVVTLDVGDFPSRPKTG
jgi:hypothetical protein